MTTATVFIIGVLFTIPVTSHKGMVAYYETEFLTDIFSAATTSTTATTANTATQYRIFIVYPSPLQIKLFVVLTVGVQVFAYMGTGMIAALEYNQGQYADSKSMLYHRHLIMVFIIAVILTFCLYYGYKFTRILNANLVMTEALMNIPHHHRQHHHPTPSPSLSPSPAQPPPPSPPLPLTSLPSLLPLSPAPKKKLSLLESWLSMSPLRYLCFISVVFGVAMIIAATTAMTATAFYTIYRDEVLGSLDQPLRAHVFALGWTCAPLILFVGMFLMVHWQLVRYRDEMVVRERPASCSSSSLCSSFRCHRSMSLSPWAISDLAQHPSTTTTTTTMTTVIDGDGVESPGRCDFDRRMADMVEQRLQQYLALNPTTTTHRPISPC